ncbi:alpha/beta fold hydrolase [Tistrella bauzanensis]
MTIVTRHRPEPIDPPVTRLRSRRGMHVEISGEGPPLIFVNGLFQSIDSWQGVQSLLPQTVMSVGFDMLNQGLSDSGPDIVTFDDHCTVIADLFDELCLDISSATLVGFSAGADIVRSLVSRGRLSPRHVVLGAVSTPGFQSYWRQWFNNLARVADTGDVDMLVRVIAFHMFSPGFIEDNPGSWTSCRCAIASIMVGGRNAWRDLPVLRSTVLRSTGPRSTGPSPPGG